MVDHQRLAEAKVAIEQMLTRLGYELWEWKLGGQGHKPVLTLAIDKAQGVTAEDCSEVARTVGHYLDVIDPISTRYELKVTSPGVDRVLFKPEHFERFAGRLVSVKLSKDNGKRGYIRGRLVGLRGQSLIVEREGEEQVLDLRDVVETRLQFQWPAEDTNR